VHLAAREDRLGVAGSGAEAAPEGADVRIGPAGQKGDPVVAGPVVAPLPQQRLACQFRGAEPQFRAAVPR
jgi:hypothetical protein